MKTYFTLSTTSTEAIDNVTFYGYAPLQPLDILRLINAHAKYPFSFQCLKRVKTNELGETKVDPALPNVYYRPLSSIILYLDDMVLHRRKVVTHESVDYYDEFEVDTFSIHDGDGNDGYYYIEFSDGDFKSLCKDRTAMIAENRRVGDTMKWLFAHNIEFEYAGSRAKLRFPMKHYNNRYLKIGNRFSDCACSTVIKCGIPKTTREEIVEEIPFNN